MNNDDQLIILLLGANVVLLSFSFLSDVLDDYLDQ